MNRNKLYTLEKLKLVNVIVIHYWLAKKYSGFLPWYFWMKEGASFSLRYGVAFEERIAKTRASAGRSNNPRIG